MLQSATVQDSRVRDARPARGWFFHGLVAANLAIKIGLAAFVTKFALVDDAYITLRHARSLVSHGELVFNPGDAVLGITTPLYGLLTTAIFATAGAASEIALLITGFLFWVGTVYAGARVVGQRYRTFLVLALLWFPTFVDNQMLGMETPLFVFLMVGSAAAVVANRLHLAAAALGLLLITRPEAVLFAPFLALLLVKEHGWGAVRRVLSSPVSLALLAGPGVIWAGFAWRTYGSILPQSALAKTGWHDAAHATVATLEEVALSLPRLTLFPYTDFFPKSFGLGIAFATLALTVWIGVRAWRARDGRALAWFGFCVLYLLFFLVGRGSTTASWYSVPCGVALFFAAEPAFPRFPRKGHRLAAFGLCLVLCVASVVIVAKRATISLTYLRTYGAAAEWLLAHPDGATANDPPNDPPRVATGEIGVLGYRCPWYVVDLKGLVSPRVTELRNEGASVTEILRDTAADYAVVYRSAQEGKDYDTTDPLWLTDAEEAWFRTQVTELARFEDKVVLGIRR